MAIVSLVGKHSAICGMAGRMLTALERGGVNAEMIGQGASILCVVDGRDGIKALNLVHESYWEL